LGVGAAATLTWLAVVEQLAFAALGIGGVIVVAGLAALGWRRLRSSRRATDAPNASGCGCSHAGPPSEATHVALPDAPAACTLEGARVPERAASFRTLFSQHHIRSERLEGGVRRWRFAAAPGVLEEITRLAEAEHGCCGFMTFNISAVGAELWWDMQASEEAAPALDAFFDLPALRSPSHPAAPSCDA